MANNGEFIKVDIDDARVKKAFEGLIARGEDFTPVTEEIANHLYNLTDEAFDDESSYTGTPWARLADSTVKAKGHGRILWDEGDMRGSLFSEADDSGAFVGVNAHVNDYPYPAVHQFGAENAGRSKNITIEARPYLPFDEHGEVHDGVIDEIVLLLEEYLQESF